MTNKFALTLLAGAAISLATTTIAKPGAATGGASCDTSTGTPTITLNEESSLQAHSKYFASPEDALSQCQQAVSALQAAQNNNQAKYLVAEGRQICFRGDRKSGCEGEGVYKVFEVKAGANGQLALLDMLDRQPDPKDIHRTLGIMYIPTDNSSQ